jgi:hypothetical protein
MRHCSASAVAAASPIWSRHGWAPAAGGAVVSGAEGGAVGVGAGAAGVATGVADGAAGAGAGSGADGAVGCWQAANTRARDRIGA